MRTRRSISTRFRVRAGIFAILLAFSVLIVVRRWQVNPVPLLWSDIREGNGAMLSLAAGKDPSGSEIVVAGGYFRSHASDCDLRVLCYDSANGQVRREAREDKYGKGLGLFDCRSPSVMLCHSRLKSVYMLVRTDHFDEGIVRRI